MATLCVKLGVKIILYSSVGEALSLEKDIPIVAFHPSIGAVFGVSLPRLAEEFRIAYVLAVPD